MNNLSSIYDAIDRCTIELTKQKSDPTWTKLRGVLFEMSGNFENAIRDFSEINLKYPNDLDSYFLKAYTYLKMSEENLAVKVLNNLNLNIRIQYVNSSILIQRITNKRNAIVHKLQTEVKFRDLNRKHNFVENFSLN